jgi:hypothetical protein
MAPGSQCCHHRHLLCVGCLQVDSVVIAKMDGTENEHADVDVKGFPTILFFPADADKKAINFEGGDRSLKVCWLSMLAGHEDFAGQ